MIQPKEKIDFKMLDYKRLENEFVSFKLEDGTVVKVKVDLDRVGKATTFKNPDGTPHYAINTSVKLASGGRKRGATRKAAAQKPKRAQKKRKPIKKPATKVLSVTRKTSTKKRAKDGTCPRSTQRPTAGRPSMQGTTRRHGGRASSWRPKCSA